LTSRETARSSRRCKWQSTLRAPIDLHEWVRDLEKVWRQNDFALSPYSVLPYELKKVQLFERQGYTVRSALRGD